MEMQRRRAGGDAAMAWPWWSSGAAGLVEGGAFVGGAWPEEATCKSSLVVALATEQFTPHRRLTSLTAFGVPITIIDTSSSLEQKPKFIADAVVLTYACVRHATLERLSAFWLPVLQRLLVKLLCTLRLGVPG